MIRILVLALLLAAPAIRAEEAPRFAPDEIAQLLRHGPWPPSFAPDASNRVSGNPAAAELGAALFFDARLSPDATLSCASCHDPARAWTDGRATGVGRRALARNAPSLADARLHRWFGWDGASDSLWAASLRPILAPDELAGTPATTAGLLRGDSGLSRCYARAFGRPAEEVADLALTVDAAKALAAFQETLATGRTKFDAFRDALASGAPDAGAKMPAAAQRGARIFVGRGNCALCHLGPAFTNLEFHDIGVPFFTPDGGADGGRHRGLAALRASPFTLLGDWNDDPSKASGVATRHVEAQHRNFGEFRVPSLRNVARTAPYMHDGRFATLGDVVRHYSRLDPDRLHSDGEAILRPLGLSDPEIDDLVAFLEALTAETPKRPASACGRDIK
jgi:cytochrome c peroxidase